jgi:ribosomal protein S18 acetylase RimI-like enzyme
MEVGGAAPVSLRSARAADAPALARLFAASRRAAMPWLPVLWTAEQEQAWMAGTVLPACEVTIADAEGGALVGFVARRGEWIDHLYLAPAWRRSGVASALLAFAGGGEAAPPVLRLHAFARNAAARAFYERQGFRAVGESDGSDNEEREPSVLYERRRPRASSEPTGGTTK